MYGSGVFYSGIGYAIGTVLSELFLLPVYEQLGIISIYQVGSLYTANFNKIYINPIKISSFLCVFFFTKRQKVFNLGPVCNNRCDKHENFHCVDLIITF